MLAEAYDALPFPLFAFQSKTILKPGLSFSLILFTISTSEEETNPLVSFALAHLLEQITVKSLHDEVVSSLGHVLDEFFLVKESVHDLCNFSRILGSNLYLFDEGRVSVNEMHEISINS